jgi:hypothetical protein
MSRSDNSELALRGIIALLSATPAKARNHVDLSDEEAFLIQTILDDTYLWFDRVYGEQVRRYRPSLSNAPDDPW